MKRTLLLSLATTLGLAALAPAPAPASPALDAALLCRKGITKAGQVYTHKRRVLLTNCADKLAKCEVLQEVDGIAANSCRSKAENSCKNTIGPAVDTPLSKNAAKFDLKAGTFCAGADFATGVLSNAAGGLWYANDADCGASVDLPSLVDCLRLQLDAQVDEWIGTISPRAGLLIDNIGLGANFPNLPRPVTIDVLVSATAPASGTLVNPGTILPGAGEAIRFLGDATTLPCGGMGNNGRITVTVLTLGALCNDTASVQQQFSFKEPYGVGDSATVGPFTTDVTYCVALKDGSCDDEVTGTIDVP